MADYGYYTGWEFNSDEWNSVIGLDGHHVNSSLGARAEQIIQELNDEEDAFWQSLQS
jgi:hypothetical protein